MKFDIITINAIIFYFNDKNAHKCCTVMFNILFNVHQLKLLIVILNEI